MRNLDERVVRVANYLLDNKATVRQTAVALGMSKSVVWNDASIRLPKINKRLSRRVNKQFEKNKAERHIRGGMRTRELYKHSA